jgi:O-acetyl-ADP-ribose deacetylase (regulator of RNase III)
MCKRKETFRMIKIETKIGNLMDVKSGHIVHGCNAKGVMGSGVALAVKKVFPEAYKDYLRHYESDDGLVLGEAYPIAITTNLVIWNAITQEGFGAPTRNCSYDAIQTCFEQINDTLSQTKSDHCELHIPAIGAGLGGGNWEIIREIIEQTIDFPTTLWILPT